VWITKGITYSSDLFMKKLQHLFFLFSCLVMAGISCFAQQADTCLPTVKKSRYQDPESGEITHKNKFYLPRQKGKPLLSYVSYNSWGSCNDEGIEIGGHEWRKDSLIVYNYWCHAGDPSGHNWGGQIAIYHWDCTVKKFKKLDSRLYIEAMGYEGGLPLSSSEKDPETVKAREKFKRETAKEHGGRFVIGKEAIELVDRARQFLKKDIDEATKSWPTAYGPNGGAGSGFGYRK
jgi:hypothetical protein